MYKARVPTDLLPVYECAPAWVPQQHRRGHPHYDNDLRDFLPRKYCLRRNQITDTLGFNVRGGEDQKCGIYIAWVKPESEALQLGLQEGDQDYSLLDHPQWWICVFFDNAFNGQFVTILEVNGISFESINHADAVATLKGSLDVYITVRYFPYGYRQTQRDELVMAPRQ